MTTEVSRAVLQFSVPLPPPALRSNSRVFWRTKMAARQTYSADVAAAVIGQEREGNMIRLDEEPWKVARVTYTWRYCGNAPDRANIGPNVKTLQDCLCMAPNTGKLAVNHMTYLGIIEDDKGIEPVYLMERVSRRAQQGVTVLIERFEHEHALCAQDWHRCDGGGPGEYQRYIDGKCGI